MELGEAAVGPVTVMFAFATLQLYTGGQATGTIQNDQLEALVSAFRSASANGFQIAMTFLGVGSTPFFYLFYKSRYIPRPLAAQGVFASVAVDRAIAGVWPVHRLKARENAVGSEKPTR